MKSFRSERDLERYLRKISEEREAARRKRTQNVVEVSGTVTETVTVSQEGESVTNTQHEGVDEGGIVKVHGNHLVILRRGRLFTVNIGDGALQPVSQIDAFAPGINPEQSWYDEMLISGDTIVVIGYSYERDGTEVGFFQIDAHGQLSYRSTYHLRSNDYYSSRNYASRLIGNKLIFYSPLYLDTDATDPLDSLPAVRKWRRGAAKDDFRRIVSAKRVYVPEAEFDTDDGIRFHTVTTCDLSNGGFDCRATTVIGPPGHVFYVSPDAVYVWAASWTNNRDKVQSLLFRMPLDGSGPSALRASGAPVDQFSFLESKDQHLNVLVRSQSKGDGMWAAEVSEGDVALMRIPLTSFADGSDAVPKSSYRQLPHPIGYGFQNRFVRDYLIYGTGTSWVYPEKESNKPVKAYFVNWAHDGASQQLELPHGVERIEKMGDDAVLVGGDEKDLHFTAVRLGQRPEIASRYVRKDAAQGESRSHGFFYKPDSDESGTLGLPISMPGRSKDENLFDTSAAILFLRNDELQFREIGELGAQAEKAVDDQCRASCVDWYGNARPLFLRGRLFALLGYELVEGKIDSGRVRELKRINFAPKQ